MSDQGQGSQGGQQASAIDELAQLGINIDPTSRSVLVSSGEEAKKRRKKNSDGTTEQIGQDDKGGKDK